MSKIHWRKTAKTCSKCNKLRSYKQFIEGIQVCVICDFDELTQKHYQQCRYCKNWQKKGDFPKRRRKKDQDKESSICKKCLQIFRERHSLFKKAPRLKKGELYLCSGCNILKSCLSFPRGSSTTPTLLCKGCHTNARIKENGEFRCKGCGSVFSIDQIYCNKYCNRCYEKNKEWNKYKLRELRKDPIWAEYFKEMSRYQYYNVFKPIYNKVLALQICYGVAKKRKVNRNGYFYILNHALFDDFRKRFQYWESLTNKVISAMKNRNSAEKMEEISRRKGQGLSANERNDLDLPPTNDWDF